MFLGVILRRKSKTKESFGACPKIRNFYESGKI
jgi:hypothetical protein